MPQVSLTFDSFPEIEIDVQGTQKWIAETVLLARNILNTGMQKGPQTGRFYPRAGGALHQASATGEWPAVDTGNLRRSTRMAFSGLTGEIGSNVDYAEYLIDSPRRLYAEAMNEAIEMKIEDLAKHAITVTKRAA